MFLGWNSGWKWRYRRTNERSHLGTWLTTRGRSNMKIAMSCLMLSSPAMVLPKNFSNTSEKVSKNCWYQALMMWNLGQDSQYHRPKLYMNPTILSQDKDNTPEAKAWGYDVWRMSRSGSWDVLPSDLCVISPRVGILDWQCEDSESILSLQCRSGERWDLNEMRWDETRYRRPECNPLWGTFPGFRPKPSVDNWHPYTSEIQFRPAHNSTVR